MKIVGVSSFNDETVDDILIADHVNKAYAETITTYLQKCCGEHGEYFPKLVNDDYNLYDASTIY